MQYAVCNLANCLVIKSLKKELIQQFKISKTSENVIFVTFDLLEAFRICSKLINQIENHILVFFKAPLELRFVL